MKQQKKRISQGRHEQVPVTIVRAADRLPLLAAPIARGVASHPMIRRVALSGYCQECFGACVTLPTALRAICERLCLDICAS